MLDTATAIGEDNARKEQRKFQKQRIQEGFNEEKEQRFEEEVDWQAYFESIKHVCPWSLKAFMQDKILHITVDDTPTELTWTACFRGSNYEALLFEYPHETTIDMLLSVVNKIEKQHKELIAFWSHPSEKDQNTPKPCVIVQDRELLTDLRKKIGFEDE